MRTIGMDEATGSCRAVSDLLTNLGARMSARFVRRRDAEHGVRVEAGRVVWLRNGRIDPRLSELASGIVGLLRFSDLTPDARYAFRAVPSGRDPLRHFADEIFDEMAHLLGGPAPVPARAAIVNVTHDVDNPRLLTAFQLARSTVRYARGHREEGQVLSAAAAALIGRTQDPHWCFDRIGRLGDEHGFRSTYFFYAAYAGRHPRDPRYRLASKRFRALCAALRERGDEIGLHSGIRYDNFSAPRDDAGGERMRSHRAHYWSAPPAPRDRERYFDSLAHAGFTADASLSPLTTGTVLGSCYPIRYTTTSGEPLTLYPSQFMDAYHRREGSAGALLDGIGGVPNATMRPYLNLNWHVRVFSSIGPWAGYGDDFERLLQAIGSRFEIEFQTMSESTRTYGRIFDAAQFA